jgi:alpha,alpha-trehalase
VSEQVPIRRRIDALWTLLTRDEPIVAPYSSLLPLPRPYVVPGGRFSELYYWDSYFTMLGLAESGRRDLLEGMAKNFADLMDTYGHAPNGTRSYYLSRSQPPFFFEMVSLLSRWDPAAAFARYLPELKTEYAYWMDGANELKAGGAHRHAVALEDGSILNRYWDDSDAPRDESYREDVELAAATPRPPQEIYRDIRAGAESGWDFSSRWFADARTMASIDATEIIPVDLNAVMFGLENAIRAGCERAGDHDCAEDFAKRASARRAAIDRYLWNLSRGVYLDIAGPRSSQSTISPPQPSIRCSPGSRAKRRPRRWRKPSRRNS